MFKINPLFQNALPRLTDEELKQLEDNIISDGEVYEPLTIWNDTIIDGHNRWSIIQKHPEIPYRTRNIEFESEWDAIVWICKNQLGKRNLTEMQKTYALGKRYEAEKNISWTRNRNHDESGRFTIGYNDCNVREQKKTCEVIAEEQGVGRNTVNDAYKFSKAVDEADELVPGFREAVVSGNTITTRKEVMSLNKMDDEAKKEAAEKIMSGERLPKQPQYQPREEDIPIGSAPYDETDFQNQINGFPKELDDMIRLFLAVHGDMLSKRLCKKAFKAMLKEIVLVAKKYEEVANEH